MQHHLEPYCDMGPGLLLDEQFTSDYRALTFNEAFLDDAFLENARRGECLYLKDEGARYFSGPTLLHIDEPAPDLVKYADRKALGLRLELPTGKLRLIGLSALIKDSTVEPGGEEFLTTQLPPGTYVADVYGFVEQQVRLEDPAMLLPGEAPVEQPPTRWTRPLELMLFALGTLTLGAVLFFCVFWRVPTLLVATVVALGVLWPLRIVLYRTSGERARDQLNAKLWKEHLARLPELPSYLVVLRYADPGTAPSEGGGLL